MFQCMSYCDVFNNSLYLWIKWMTQAVSIERSSLIKRTNTMVSNQLQIMTETVSKVTHTLIKLITWTVSMETSKLSEWVSIIENKLISQWIWVKNKYCQLINKENEPKLSKAKIQTGTLTLCSSMILWASLNPPEICLYLPHASFSLHHPEIAVLL
jgi:hypothetical protein